MDTTADGSAVPARESHRVQARRQQPDTRSRQESVRNQSQNSRRHALAQYRVICVSIKKIRVNPRLTRKHFDEHSLAQLASSIRERGLLQPVLVKQKGKGFLLAAGGRRLRAAKIAGLTEIPALLTDQDPLQVFLVENLQRKDLSPTEEAEGYGRLVEQHGYTREQIAEKVGKSAYDVATSLVRTKVAGKAALSPRARRAVRYVRRNFKRDISLDHVADVVGVSKCSLCRLFKRATGLTFTQYVNLLRLEEARRLLLTSDTYIFQIAYKAGFQNINYFRILFKRSCGCSPSEYKSSVQLALRPKNKREV